MIDEFYMREQKQQISQHCIKAHILGHIYHLQLTLICAESNQEQLEMKM